MTRAGLVARLRRLERPRTGRDAMRRELERLERLYPPTRPDFESMTDEQLDDYLAEMCSYNSPHARIAELREALKTPEEKAADKRRSAEFAAMSDEQLDEWLQRYQEQSRTGAP